MGWLYKNYAYALEFAPTLKGSHYYRNSSWWSGVGPFGVATALISASCVGANHSKISIFATRISETLILLFLFDSTITHQFLYIHYILASMEPEPKKLALLQFWKKSSMIFDERVLEAFASVPREEFLTEEMKPFAYEDRPLTILRGKTISQPTTVLIMTQALDIQPGEKILEVGTGSGYQSAILSRLVGPQGKICSTEILPELVEFARNNLSRLNITNITVEESDGSQGLANHAPFDKIIITAAAKDFPDALIAQLKDGGLIIAPVGDKNEQEMVLARKQGKQLDLDFLGQFLFSPLTGKWGFEE